jgi:arabinose-5-phosphate isomerase
MMLALGDALAVAVLRGKGFTQSEFRHFHPGGKLGASLKRAVDLMHHKDMPLCAPDQPVDAAIATISDSGFGCVGVVDAAGRLVGMVTDGDLRRHYGLISRGAKVSDVMTAAPHIVSADSLAGEVLALFADRKITAVFIVDEAGKPAGLVHVHDCLATGVL